MSRIRAVEVTGELKIPIHEQILIDATTNCVEAVVNQVEAELKKRIGNRIEHGDFEGVTFKFLREP